LVWSDSDVTSVTPVWTPGVLDEDVVLTVEVTETNSEDTVIELLTATGGDDTTSVGLEDGLIGFDGNGDWGVGDGSLELGGGTLLDILVTVDLTDTLGGVVLASTLSGSVWVLSLGFESVLLDVFEGVVHKTTVATHVTVGTGAVNELLLGVGLESTGLDEHSTFDGTGGGERPA